MPKSTAFPNRTPWVAAVLILAAVIGAYANSFRVPFLFDDKRSIEDNPHIRHLFPLSEAMRAPPLSGVSGRPILSLSLALNYACSGLNVWGYHLANLLIHATCAILLFLVIRLCLVAAKTGHSESRTPTNLALAAAALWALHPLQTMSVTYVIQRAESLMSLMVLMTLYASLRAAHSELAWAWSAVAIICCALGAGCKEVAVVTPALVFLFDWVLIYRSFKEQARRRWPLYAGLAASWVLLAWLNASNPRSASAGFGLANMTPWQYLRTQPEVLLHYVRLALWPTPLCFDYDWAIQDNPARIALCSTIVVGGLVLTVWGLWRRHAIALAPGVFFLILAPSSSFVPIIVVASEHRIYLPLASICILTALAGRWLISRAIRNAARIAGGVVMIGTCAALAYTTHQRNEDYQSSLTIWTDVVAKRPQNVRARNNAGNELRRAGRNIEALVQYQAALRIDPKRFDVLYNLGVAQAELGQLDDATHSFETAAALQQSDGNIQAALANSLRRSGRPQDALSHAQVSLSLLPGYGRANEELGLCLVDLGRSKEAIIPLKAALEGSGSIEAAFALAWIRAADPDEALRSGSEAMQIANWIMKRTDVPRARALDLLAASYAEAARFADAVTAAQRAFDACQVPKDAKLAEQIFKRLALYQLSKPFRAVAPPRSETP